MTSMIYRAFFLLAAVLMPVAAFAARGACGGDGLGRVICTLGELVGGITPVVVALALLAFFWGLAMYVLNFSGEDKDKKKGRDMMVYGIIVLFVMVSVWGIVSILQNTFFTGSVDNTQGALPCVKIEGGLPCN